MIALGESQALEGVATDASKVTYTISGCLITPGTPPAAAAYEVLAQGQLPSSAGSIYNPGASNYALISSIHLFNTNSSTETVTLYIEGTAGSNEIAVLGIPAGGFATYEDGVGWTVYSAAGLQLVSGAVLTVAAGDTSIIVGGTTANPTLETGTLDAIAADHPPAADWSNNSHKITSLANGVNPQDAAAFGQVPGGEGTPDSTAASLTASSANVLAGSLFQLPTSFLAVGMRFRWVISLTKTAAGLAVWTAAVKFGTAGTNSDGAIATWTSGTNTALIDKALLIIESRITALGSGTSATAACTAFYVNAQGTTSTGLGDIAAAPGATAGFNSTATTPFMHIDVTPGTSAVMTGWAMAERTK